MMIIKKRISVLKYSEKIIFSSWYQVDIGRYSLMSAFSVPYTEDTAELGKQVWTALDISQSGPSDADWSKSYPGKIDPVLEAAGVKSRATFMKSVKSIGIRLDNDGLNFSADRNVGSRGFLGIKGTERRIQSDASLESVGETLLATFEDAL